MANIPIPQKGTPITLEWGKAVTERCNAARAIGTGGLVRSGPFGLGEAPLPINRRDRRLQPKLTPFAIRLQYRENQPYPQWLIYLPSEQILTYNGAIVSPYGGLTAAQGNWYILDIPIDGGTVYLNLISDEGESSSGDSVPTAAQYSTESQENSIAIAEVSYDKESKQVLIKQLVTSALHFTSGGGISIQSITSDADESDSNTTTTNVTVTMTDGTEHEFKVSVKNGSGDAPGGGGNSGSLSFVGDIRYDMSSHQIQKRVDTYDFATKQVTQGEWTMIEGGQAVPHSSTIL